MLKRIFKTPERMSRFWVYSFWIITTATGVSALLMAEQYIAALIWYFASSTIPLIVVNLCEKNEESRLYVRTLLIGITLVFLVIALIFGRMSPDWIAVYYFVTVVGLFSVIRTVANYHLWYLRYLI